MNLDISNFNKVSDYLPLFNSVLITDIFFMFMLYYPKIIKSKQLERWYETYRLSGVLADVTIIIIGFIITRFLYYKIFKSYSWWKFLILLLIVQIIHDLLFAGFFTLLPKGVNKMLDMFKDYAGELGLNAIIGDSFMMITAFFLFIWLKNKNLNSNIIVLIFTLYITPYILYTN